LNPILYLLYYFFKGLVRLGLWGYFERITYIHPERLRFRHACIVISNHPNTMLDPLLACVKVSKEVFFLANYGLFKKPFHRWFFSTFYCIPVQRPQDVNGAPLRNDHSFAHAEQHLSAGGCLYTAPEGASWMISKISPLRTGTARIALGTEHRNDFRLELTILPVGIDYTAPHLFRSRAVVNVGLPIQVARFQSRYQADPTDAVVALTAHMENQLRSLTLDFRTPIEQRLIAQLQEVLSTAAPQPDAVRFKLSQQLLAAWRALEQTDPTHYQEIYQRTLQYHKLIRANHLRDTHIAHRSSVGRIAGMLGLSPIAIFGLTNNLLPAAIPWLVRQRMQLYIGYDSTVKILAGLVSFPLFYLLQSYLVWQLTGHRLITAAYLLCLVPTGLLGWRWLAWTRQWLGHRRFRQLKRRAPLRHSQIQQLRRHLLSDLRSLLPGYTPVPLQE
jgi:1-acyl-sn-glycerol-3-phosphate acyltransferase